jgi:hypothetical protein
VLQPLQLENLKPALGVATSVTWPPGSTKYRQTLGHRSP